MQDCRQSHRGPRQGRGGWSCRGPGAGAGVMDAGEGEVAGQARAEVVPRTEAAQSELQVPARKRRSGGGGAGGGDAC